ncbi:MAG TPA: adenylate/guanylate cyclase domain-containing protein [Anaerolineae bacterium]|nr:adenylate/guanylate cyclase domain-containing protein [Anaerolineae bacterium]
MSDLESQIAELRTSIAALEAQRAVLGEVVVNAALGPMREKLAALEAALHAPAFHPKESDAEGERKVVTILFADISGFTALSETLDPEQVTDIANACFQSLTDAVTRYGGTIDKYLGDAVMALFGAPDAHEDDPERAIHAALEMQSALRQTISQLSPVTGNLTLHIGVNTGPVVAGAVGAAGLRDYTVMGDAVNLASRLKDVAPIGHIYVGPETYRQTSRLFEFAPLAPMRIKGKRDPVQIYEVRGRAASPGTMRGIEGLRSPLVGRGDELDLLNARLRSLPEGKGSIVALTGEAGLGKSRLISELHVAMHTANTYNDPGPHAHLSGESAVLWLEGRCTSFTQSVSYSLIAQVLRSYFGLSGSLDASEALERLQEALEAVLPGQGDELAPYLGTLLGWQVGGERVRYLDAEALQRQIFYSVRRFVGGLSMQTPLVIVLDDLHWIDEASLVLLESLLQLVEDHPLMMVWAFRPGAEQTGIQQLAGRFAQDGSQHFYQVDLRPLADDMSQALVRLLLARSDLPEPIQAAIVERAEGNPFYLEEVIRTLIESGLLIERGGRWVVDPQIPDVESRIRSALPDTLIGVLTARIDRLPEQPKRALGIASVVGRSFSRRLMTELIGSQAAVDEALAELERSGLVESGEATPLGGAQAAWGPTYSFRHVLAQEAAYNMLLQRRRVQLHGEIGGALERLHWDEVDEYAALLAYHYDRSQNDAKAITYGLRAGRAALRVYANREAAGFFARVVNRLRESEAEDAQLAEALEALGDARSASGEVNAAIGFWQEALVMHTRFGGRESAARLNRKLGNAWFTRGDRARAIESYRRGIDAVSDLPPGETLAGLYAELGRVYFRAGQDAQAIDWAARALDLAESMGSAETASLALNTLGIARARGGELAHGIAEVERGLQIAIDNDLPVAACRAYTNLGMLYGAVDHSRAVQLCQQGLALARKIGDLYYQSWLQSSLASTYCSLVGNWERGVAAARASIDLDLQMGHRAHLAVPVVLLAQIYQCHGMLEESLRAYREALALAEESGEPQMLFPCYNGLGALYLDIGDEEQATTYLDKAQQVVSEAGYSADSLFVLPFLA